MTNNEYLTLEEQFAAECTLINLKYEYAGYTGNEQWAIVSELTSEELMSKYADIIADYIPFIRLLVSQGEAISEYNRIEDKYKKRAARSGYIFDVGDGEFEQHHPEVAYEPDYIAEMETQENIDRLYKAINSLSELQKRRIIKYFFNGATYGDIAFEEGVSKQSVEESIKAAIKKIKKVF